MIGGKEAERVVRQCERLLGFEGEIWPVHPERVRSLERAVLLSARSSDLPGVPDAAFIAIAA